MGQIRASTNRWDSFKKFLFYRNASLYDDIAGINVYRNHRESLRPWDRKLPPIVEQEARRRAMWITHPPSGWWMSLMLTLCILLWECIGLLPILSNYETVKAEWRDAHKPKLVYTNTAVLLASWVVIHLCTGFSLWFLWLTEGFDKHKTELVPFFLAGLCECCWVDMAFYNRRLDWVVLCWVLVALFVILTQVFMFRGGVEIGTLFLLPHLFASIVMIAYAIAFIQLGDATWERREYN